MMDYRKMTVEQLKNELRKRGAKLSGRKGELLERLEAYDRNNNFGYNEPENVEKMVVPEKLQYKDVNASSVVPAVNERMVDEFFYECEVNKISDTAKRMYENKFLQFIQVCGKYVKGCVAAEMRKKVSYCVDLKIEDDSITETQCDCAVGAWPSAHCKHVMVVILALLDFAKKKECMTYDTCTSVIQNFHKPKKRHAASPLRCEKLSKKSLIRGEIPAPTDLNKLSEIDLHNKIKNFCSLGSGKMAFSQILAPANPSAAMTDHDYLQYRESDQLLIDLKLMQVIKKKTPDSRMGVFWQL